MAILLSCANVDTRVALLMAQHQQFWLDSLGRTFKIPNVKRAEWIGLWTITAVDNETVTISRSSCPTKGQCKGCCERTYKRDDKVHVSHRRKHHTIEMIITSSLKMIDNQDDKHRNGARNKRRRDHMARAEKVIDNGARNKRNREDMEYMRESRAMPPPRRLNFGNYKNSEMMSKLTSGSKTRKPPVGVKIKIFSKHMMIAIPAFDQDGWIPNLSDAIAIAKHYDLNGFKLAVGVAVGNNRFGYFGFFEDASVEAEHFFSPDNTDMFEDNFKIGPPKIAKDYTGKVVGEVAAESIVADIDIAIEEGNNLIEFLADKQGPKLLRAFQLFAVAVGAAEDLYDFTFLRELQDEFHDLVPHGEDVEKYLQLRIQPVGPLSTCLHRCPFS